MPNVPPAVALREQPLTPAELHARVPPFHLTKYFHQRHRLFQRFSDGIALDDESWYSVTPEKIAAHHARRLTAIAPPGVDAVIVDAFCGCGGNAIQFARYASHVVGIDNNAARLELARHNAGVYGVAEFIDYVTGDVNAVLPALRGTAVDAVFMSPPWGGPAYIDTRAYDVRPFVALVDLARLLTPNVAILLPRNVTETDVEAHFGECELERNYLGNVLKTTTLYFGELVGLGCDDNDYGDADYGNDDEEGYVG
jgi:trimethylguanosine synthase